MGGLFGGSTIRNEGQREVALRLQNSSLGLPLPAVHGRNRVAPNLITYTDFVAIPHVESQAAGGKGGGVKTENVNYTYQVAAALAIGEGPIEGIGRVWADKDVTTLSALDLTLFRGAAGQMPWGYMVTKHPEQALAYRNIAYVAGGSYDLGDSPSLPTHTFEVQGRGRFSVGIPDAAPLTIIRDWLTDPIFGAGFPPERLGDMSAFDNYTVAAGLFMAPAITNRTAAAELIETMATLTGSAWLDSGGKLRLIPLATVPVEGLGRSFVPNITPVYHLTDDDYLDDENPVQVKRKLSSDAFNSQTLKFRDRAHDYNDNTAPAEDQANVEMYGARPADDLDAPWIVDARVAEVCANLVLGRKLYARNEYRFRLPPHFILLEPGDVVGITDTVLGYDDLPVRVTELDIDADCVLSVTAEDLVEGYGAPVDAGTQAAMGYRLDFGATGSPVANPVMFTAPDSLTGGDVQVWAAAAGEDGNWSGADIWASTDDATYRQIGGVDQPGRYGTLVHAVGVADTEMEVDLSISRGTLTGGVAANDETLTWLDGELISYQTATLIGEYRYRLTGVLRARKRTTATVHGSGARFARLDAAIARASVPSEYIGQTVHIKFVSRNVVGRGAEDIADVASYTLQVMPNPALPENPSGLRLLEPFVGTQFHAGWSPVMGANFGYLLTLSLNPGGQVHQANVTNTEWVYTASQAQTDGGARRHYQLEVSTMSYGGESESSALLIDKPAPPAPSGLAVVGTSTIALEWNPVTQDDLAGYKAWISTRSGFDPRKGEGTLIYTGTATSVDISAKVTPGVTYFARVSAYDQWSDYVPELNLSPQITFMV